MYWKTVIIPVNTESNCNLHQNLKVPWRIFYQNIVLGNLLLLRHISLKATGIYPEIIIW